MFTSALLETPAQETPAVRVVSLQLVGLGPSEAPEHWQAPLQTRLFQSWNVALVALCAVPCPSEVGWVILKKEASTTGRVH